MAIAVAEKRRDSLGSAKVREALVGYAFVILPLAFFFLFFIFPMVYAIYISRYDWGVLGPIDAVGFQNYRDLYQDELFRRALRNILVYTAFVVPGADGARAPRRGDREPEDPRPAVLPRGVLLPVARVVGRDRGDLHLPAERGRSRERDPRHQHHVLRRLRHGAAVDHGPERLDDVGDDDALLPRGAPGDPDRTSTRRPRSTAPARGARSGRSPSRCSSRGTSSSWSCRSSAA